MQREADLRADIVVSGLPEQSEPLSDVLLERIQPKVVIVADSEFPATKRAGVPLRERLERRAAKVLYARFSGAVTLMVGKSGWELRGMDGTRLTEKTFKPQASSLKPQNDSGGRTQEAH